MEKDGKKRKFDKRFIKAMAKQAVTRNPKITSQEFADKYNLNLKTGWKYIKLARAKMAELIEKDIEKLRTSTVESELAKIERENCEVIKELWTIISDKGTKDTDKVAALRSIVSARKEIFGLKFDAGLFIKSLGKLDLNVAELVKKIKEAGDGSSGDNSESGL